MIIIDNSVNEEKYFRDLMGADVFKFDDRLFMKVSHNYDSAHNSYDFTKGRLTNITDETKVQYIPSELILHESNEDFHKWFDAYLVHNALSFDISLKDPTVIYSAEFWKNEREKLEKVSISH